jgi:hypothetical protein
MKATNKSAFGTSFHDTTILASVSTLKQILGIAEYDANDGNGKTNFEWIMETDNGDVFTVYDWKEYHVLDENEIIKWHIGGNNKNVTAQAFDEMVEALDKLSNN